MAIEFHCPHCQKLLTTSESRAGQRSRCPGCGEVVAVPGEPADITGEQRLEVDRETDLSPTVPPPIPVSVSDALDFEDEPADDEAVPHGRSHCPMCGSPVRSQDTNCRACGEALHTRTRSRAAGSTGPQTVEIGAVLGESWELFSQHFGVMIGATVLSSLALFISLIPAVIAFIAAIVMANESEEEVAILIGAGGMALLLISYIAVVFVQLGVTRLGLAVVRGDEPIEIGLVWSGGPWLWRGLLATTVFMLLAFVGTLAGIVPGLIVGVLMWPYLFVLVDQDSPGIECLWRSWKITQPQWLPVIGVILLYFLIATAANSFCGLAGLVTTPLGTVLYAVCYLRLTGQATALQNRQN